jgi:hypothetical protein
MGLSKRKKVKSGGVLVAQMVDTLNGWPYLFTVHRKYKFHVVAKSERGECQVSINKRYVREIPLASTPYSSPHSMHCMLSSDQPLTYSLPFPSLSSSCIHKRKKSPFFFTISVSKSWQGQGPGEGLTIDSHGLHPLLSIFLSRR